MSDQVQVQNSQYGLDCTNIKKEPNWCDENYNYSPSVKEELEDSADELTGFDPRAWALQHLKIETRESFDECSTPSRNNDSYNITSKTNPINYCYSSQPLSQDTNFSQMVSCSYSIPHVHNVWANLEKVFYCKICNKSFSTKGNLSNHMRSHTQEKPYKCDTCGRCFSFNCNLKTHYLTHTGVKPFQCTVCGKSFSTKGNMSVHLRIHTGERPFKCPVCARSFTVKDNLQRHMKIHVSL